ncbi:hypothetical protein CYMTET_25845 [Cymbomonas tetramitiformis]|uniref:Tudor domain-containing protein n=1 Tax=Cymbomonas tetramitiformis TaxID=36881 RepID=A0AAE0KYU3_9CHLO|nr:hypothetical protein CYMTET_25845 [Cymbomonas tetramitiformis]
MLQKLLQQQQQQQQSAQQSAVMTAMMEQLTHMNANKDKGDVAGSSVQTKGDKELARRQKLLYVPYGEGSPTRTATLEARMPQLYHLYGDKTFASFNKKASSFLKYEQLVLGPALAYLYDAVQFSDDTLELLESQDKVAVSTQEIEQRVYETQNTMMGAYTLLAHRYSMVQLRTGPDGDAATHGGPEPLKAKLAFMEEKVCSNSDSFLGKPTFSQWLHEEGSGGVITELVAQTRRSQSNQPGRGSGKAQTGLAMGLAPGFNAPGTVLPSSNVLFGARAEGADSTIESAVEEGSLACGGRQFRGSNPWRIAYDFRWTNAFRRQSRCKMETLKKPHRLAKQNDWCFSFDPKDGYHYAGIDPDFQKCMQFDAQGELYQCSALPFRWNDSQRIFVKFMKCKCNGQRIWECRPRAKLHPDSSLYAWGGGLSLKLEARGFWCDELRQLHITHLELETVFKTAQAFHRELRGKVVPLYCGNQAVVARLAHFTRRNPDLMRRMRRLWSLVDFNDIELQARYFCSKANEWADRLSRDTDSDDWKLNRSWFDWAQTEWGEPTVDRFAAEISAQLPSHVSHPGTPVNVYVQARRAAASQPVPAKGAFLEVFWPLDDDWYKGTVTEVSDTGQHHIRYGDGNNEWLQLSEELAHPEQQQEAEEDNDVAPVKEWTSALRERWRGEGRERLLASEETARVYLAMLLDRGGIQATSLQPYMGWPDSAKGRSVTRAVKGMARLREAASEATGVTVTERTWLPAKHVRTVHDAELTLELKDSD